MADPAQEALKRATLTLLSSESDLDSPTLRCHLSEAGHGRSLDLLLTDSLYSRSPFARPGAPLRWEQHTSELQSLMRISYAVFCLKTQCTPLLENKNITAN